MEDQGERVHDADEWTVEAKFIIQDIKDCVKEIVISNLPSSDQAIYLNLTTLELIQYCLELTVAGFRIVGDSYDSTKSPSEDYFETPYALLDNISPLYRESFSNALRDKLLALEKQTDQENLSE